MSEYINCKKYIYVPLKPIIATFHEKEEIELNAFQKFILEAIEEDATIEQMINATQLTKSVIESELLHMESQKLLVRDGRYVSLSELSKNILMISRSVKMLNAEKKILYFNLITGAIEGFDKNIYNEIEQDALIMEGKIRSGDIIGISIEDNISFFADYMPTFDKLSEEQIDKVLSSIYAEFDEIDKKLVYKLQEINKLPCLIGDDKLEFENNAYAEGKCSIIVIEVSTDKIEKYKEQTKNIMALYTKTPELISDLGRDLIREYENCVKYNKEKIIFVYDHTSGKIREEKHDIVGSQNKRTQLLLTTEKNQMTKLKNKFSLQPKQIGNWMINTILK